MQQFTVTEDHLKLLRRMYVDWASCEFGAPTIDCKRPYGNGDVLDDIAEIIGIPARDADNDEDFSPADEERMRRLHRETEQVLAVALAVGYFKAGRYQASNYDNDWKEIV